MLWLALGASPAMENQVLVIRIKIPNSGAVDWTVHSGPQLLFRDVLVSGNLSGQIPVWGSGTWILTTGGLSWLLVGSSYLFQPRCRLIAFTENW